MSSLHSEDFILGVQLDRTDRNSLSFTIAPNPKTDLTPEEMLHIQELLQAAMFLMAALPDLCEVLAPLSVQYIPDDGNLYKPTLQVVS